MNAFESAYGGFDRETQFDPEPVLSKDIGELLIGFTDRELILCVFMFVVLTCWF